MLKEIHMAHITGTANVLENNWLYDKVEFNQPRHTIGQMFFKPYQSKKEFIFCARHTATPLVFLGLNLLSEFSLVIVPIIFVFASATYLLFHAAAQCVDSRSTFWLNLAKAYISPVIQGTIDLVLLPIALMTMITRSISTGLKAADIYDYDAPKNNVGAIHSAL